MNILLSDAWEEYTKRIESGELAELEAKYSALTRAIVNDVVPTRDALESGS